MTTSAELHFTKPDGSTVFIDETGRVWTPIGNALYCGGDDYLFTDASSGFDFSLVDVTIECQVKIDNMDLSIWEIFYQSGGGNGEYFFNIEKIAGLYYAVCYINPIGGGFSSIPICDVEISVSAGVWYHFAMVKNGTTYSLFMDGIEIGQHFDAGGNPNLSGTSLVVGYSNEKVHMGSIDDFKFTKGVGLYPAGIDFTPPVRTYCIPPPEPPIETYATPSAILPNRNLIIANDQRTGAAYELWLTDDAGRRLFFLDKPANFSYSRSVMYLSILQLEYTFKEWVAMTGQPFFKPDWRIDVWRSPAPGYPLRREDMYMLRKPEVMTREDGVQMIMLRGRNGNDLLNRRFCVQYEDSIYSAENNEIDDGMKQIVRQQSLYGSCRSSTGVLDNTRAFPQNEFTVQANHSLGPVIEIKYAGRKMMDIIKELSELSFAMNAADATNRKIYFGVVPVELSGTTGNPAKVGYEFRTYADLRGVDRTQGIEFSVENGNMKSPTYIESHYDEVNTVYVMGQGTGTLRRTVLMENLTLASKSRWNRCEDVKTATLETDDIGLENAGDVALGEGRPIYSLDCAFLNSPGSENTPRSLYGVDWDMGDLLRVNYAGKQFDVEVINVYVAVDENGAENISGRNAQDGE
jgi:hypothetical protein